MVIQATDGSAPNEYAAIEKLLRSLERTGKHYDVEKIKKVMKNVI